MSCRFALFLAVTALFATSSPSSGVAASRFANDACTTCHTSKTVRTHPMGILPPSGAEVRTQPDGTIGCVTCHVGHDGQIDDEVWAAQIDRSVCVECHWSSGSAHQMAAELVHMLRDTDARRVEARSLTRVCSGCHASRGGHGDAVVASAGWSGASLGISHPVLIDYDRSARSNQRVMRPASDLPADVLLEDGEVGCTSCHDLYSGFSNHLIRANAESDLCLACHSLGALPVYAGVALPKASGMRPLQVARVTAPVESEAPTFTP